MFEIFYCHFVDSVSLQTINGVFMYSLSTIPYFPTANVSQHNSWQDVEQMRFSVGKILNNDQNLGCGILIGIDRMLVPYHVISGTYADNLEICLQNDSHAYKFNGLKFLILNPELDFCILQLSKNEQGFWPGQLIDFPEISFQKYSGSFVFARFDGETPSTQIVQLGVSCHESHFYSIVETLPGCSGSGYLEPSKKLFAMHLYRSTGLCGINSDVRKALYLSAISSSSAEAESILSIPKDTPCCLPAEKAICAPTFTYTNTAYVAEGGRPSINGKVGNMAYWEYRPTNSSGAGPRGVTVSPPDTRSKITYMFSENPHDYGEYNHSKDQAVLYRNAAQAYLNTNTITPTAFSFSAFGLNFNAVFLEKRTYG